VRQARRGAGQHRRLHATPRREKEEEGFSLSKALLTPFTNTKRPGTYYVFGATERIYKTCGAQADYRITEADRKEGKIRETEEGEEIGMGGGMWHDGEYISDTLRPDCI
jgi:hypothetical protein